MTKFIGGLIGVGVGRYAGKKVTKNIKKKKPFTHEQLFILKLKCLLKMGSMQKKELKHNLNLYRLQLEKVIGNSA